MSPSLVLTPGSSSRRVAAPHREDRSSSVTPSSSVRRSSRVRSSSDRDVVSTKRDSSSSLTPRSSSRRGVSTSLTPVSGSSRENRAAGRYQPLTLNAPIATKVVCFSRLLKCLRSLYGKQCGPRSDCSYRAVCSGFTLFASILNSSVMLGNYLQQTTSADDIFKCIFFLVALRVN